MKPVYRSCVFQNGNQTKKRMHEVMDNHMQKEDNSVEKEAHPCSVQMTDKVKKYSMNICADISKRLDEVIRGHDIPGSSQVFTKEVERLVVGVEAQ